MARRLRNQRNQERCKRAKHLNKDFKTSYWSNVAPIELNWIIIIITSPSGHSNLPFLPLLPPHHRNFNFFPSSPFVSQSIIFILRVLRSIDWPTDVFFSYSLIHAVENKENKLSMFWSREVLHAVYSEAQQSSQICRITERTVRWYSGSRSHASSLHRWLLAPLPRLHAHINFLIVFR